MKHEIVAQGSYPVLEVTLFPGEEFVAESGAMAWMDAAIETTTAAKGGVMGGLSRKLLTGESFFQNSFRTNRAEGAKVAFVSAQPGEIGMIEMAGQELLLEKGAYMASTPDVKIESKFQGLKGLFSEGMFVLRATGSGPMFFTGYGDLQEVAVDGEYIVDNGYAVAWDATLNYSVTKAKKIRSFLFGDQLLLKFQGNGRVWVQSRSPVSFADWVFPFRPVKKRD